MTLTILATTRPCSGFAAWAGSILCFLALACTSAPPLPFTEGSLLPGFVHNHGGHGEFFLPEVMGPGGALFDYDGDGWMDLYCVQGAPLSKSGTSPGSGGRLFRNRGPNATPRFEDVTGSAGLSATGYGIGAAVGDIDNDGHVDLYLTNYGANQLWRNRGDGTFEDWTATAGVGDSSWSASASFVDFDGDGWLDLYVANYVTFDPARHRSCRNPLGAEDYCSPLAYPAAHDTLYRNRGDGTFEDVSAESGIRREARNGLGTLVLDANGDGWLDIYVANDMQSNLLWLNQGNGSFRDGALLAGVAVNRAGKAQASMGVAGGDIDRDGNEDILLTHLRNETNTLYLQAEPGDFRDATDDSGFARASIDPTGFGVALIDFDLDGALDLVVANGAVTSIDALARAGDPFPLHERNQLFRNRGDGHFVEVTDQVGNPFEPSEVSRGLAVADLDNDGDADLVIFNNSAVPRVLLNQAAERAGARWLGVEVRDERYQRTALGAVVTLVLADGSLRRRRVSTDGSYASAGDPRVLFGLGTTSEVVAIEARWPDGWRTSRKNPSVNSYLSLSRPFEPAAAARTAL